MTSEGSTKFCRECGAKIPRDSMFCEVCGTKLTEQATVQASSQSTVAYQPRPPEKQPEIGSETWDANRKREIKELREEERKKAAEYRQKKEAGLMPDTQALPKLAAAASTVDESSGVKLPRTVVSTPSQTQTSQLCVKCGKEMRYSWEAKKWICDECQLSRDAPPPPPPPKAAIKRMFSGIAIALAVFGVAVIGGLYLEVPAVVVALYAMHRGEGKPAWTALAVSLGCLVLTVLLMLEWGRIFSLSR